MLTRPLLGLCLGHQHLAGSFFLLPLNYGVLLAD
jgi:hypothetical protein